MKSLWRLIRHIGLVGNNDRTVSYLYANTCTIVLHLYTCFTFVLVLLCKSKLILIPICNNRI